MHKNLETGGAENKQNFAYSASNPDSINSNLTRTPQELLVNNPEAERKLHFSRTVEQGQRLAESNIANRFEQDSNYRNNLAFHNRAHSEGVKNKTRMILARIQSAAPEKITERDIELGTLISAFHDTVQAWDEDKKTTRQE